MNPLPFKDYKKLLRHAIAENAATRGYQGALAKAAGCQNSYLSKVLADAKAHLSAEQAFRLAQFWRLGEDETDYWLELVQLARAAYPPLAARSREKLAAIKRRSEDLKRRGPAVTIATDTDWAYYAAWYWSALHILVGVPRFSTTEAAAKALQLDPKLAAGVLQRLAAMGLVRAVDGRWQVEPGHRHLPRESPLTALNHGNWRQRAVQDAHDPSRASLHYTVVNSHGEGDFERLKAVLLKAIDEARAIVRPAADEDVSVLCLDLFRPI